MFLGFQIFRKTCHGAEYGLWGNLCYRRSVYILSFIPRTYTAATIFSIASNLLAKNPNPVAWTPELERN